MSAVAFIQINQINGRVATMDTKQCVPPVPNEATHMYIPQGYDLIIKYSDSAAVNRRINEVDDNALLCLPSLITYFSPQLPHHLDS